MTGAELWTTVALVSPLVGAMLSLAPGRLFILAGLGLGAAGSLVGTVGLWAEVRAEGVVRHLIGGWGRPLGIELQADGLSMVFLALTAVLGTAVSVYASAYFQDVAPGWVRNPSGARGARYFAPLTLFAWTGLNGVFLSGDLFNLYVMLEIVGLSAAALVTLAVTAKATEAGMRYLLVSLSGSMLFLLGVTVLYLEHGTLSLEQIAAQAPTGAPGATALAIMTVGLAAKTALFPLHAWLPPAHSAAPAPASALLSALVVKGSFYIIVRLWVDVYGLTVPASTAEQASVLMGLLGAAAIIWGSVLAIRQRSLKRLIAYSTVAQLGYLFVMFPLLVPYAQEATGAVRAASVDAWNGGIYHALSHGLAKAAMFLAAGNMTHAVSDDAIESIAGVARRLPMSFLAFGLAGLSLAGVPPSGGFLAKWLLLDAAFTSGRWGWGIVIALGGLLTLAYVLLVARRAFDATEGPSGFRPVPRRMEWMPAVLALMAVLLGVRAVEILDMLLVGATGPWG
ncbi:MAG: proton-conducting transporter membrane subunit [Gemmatimonadota bacterium]|nr:proton-conducting transporter membrane subunit [Gemmatimonadota bacterium]